MTRALYNRLDAIESFAADVAHELKNPLTSLRSALETLPRVSAGHSRDRLIAIMQHDVRRLDRLISDISDASRLDAELARGEAGPVDVAALLRAVVSMAQDSRARRHPGRIVYPGPARQECERRLFCPWARFPACSGRHQSHRQCLLVFRTRRRSCALRSSGTSARSEPEEKPVDRVVITVDDDGPGIPPHALERIFERFYTDRPKPRVRPEFGLGTVDFAPDH